MPALASIWATGETRDETRGCRTSVDIHGRPRWDFEEEARPSVLRVAPDQSPIASSSHNLAPTTAAPASYLEAGTAVLSDLDAQLVPRPVPRDLLVPGGALAGSACERVQMGTKRTCFRARSTLAR
jgi:hypothetical protein